MTDQNRSIGETWFDGCEYCIMTEEGVKRYDTEKELMADNPGAEI
jgi:hypothetical protein